MDGLLMESPDEPNVPLVEWNRVKRPESKRRIFNVVVYLGVIMSTQNIIALQTWWMNELKKITNKVMETESKRQAKEKEKNYDLLADYNSENEILDAYGFGIITERKKDKLLNLWQKREALESDNPLYQMKIKLLSELYQTAKKIVEDNHSEGEEVG